MPARASITGLTAVLAMLLLLVTAVLASAAPASAQEGGFRRDRLEIRSASGASHGFSVELALNDAERQQGLMYRRQMPADHGMLFDFGATRRVAMWMENTFLPLDMLFIAPDGRIAHIHEHAVPLSRAIIDSRGPVRYVLELNAGRARALGIAVGDRVVGSRIGRRAAP